MYNQPYFIPGYYSNAFAPGMMRGAMAAPSMMRGAMSAPMWGAQGASRGLGLMGRLGSGISAIRSLNWGGFINNTSKTLGVINQTIPLVRQVGPMFRNVRSMLKVASVFKDETDRRPSQNSKANLSAKQQASREVNTNSANNSEISNNLYAEKDNRSSNSTDTSIQKKAEDNSPTFFIA